MTQAAAEPARSIPKPRPSPVDVRAASVPRHWFLGLPFPTHVSNGVNLLFPAGERFFVRSVRHFEARISDPHLRAEVKGFYGQEGRHAKAHEDVIQMLRDQGYEVDTFLRFYERVGIDFMERIIPPSLRLASTAAAEHFTAIMAEGALTERFFDDAHPVMRDLLLWHAAEEIEHKSVAFDVLKAVAPSYATRMAGLAISTLMLGGFWALGAVSLLRQEDQSFRDMLEAAKSSRVERGREDRGVVRDVFLAGIREYMRPDFHPDQRDTRGLAEQLLSQLSTAGAA